MNKKLIDLIYKVIESADNTGCFHDATDENSIPLTIVNADALNELEDFIKVFTPRYCRRCGATLVNDFCTDVTCRY